MQGASYQRDPFAYSLLPQFGCVVLLLAMMLTCLMPLVFVDVLTTALNKLHLSRFSATLVLLLIVGGGFVNLPIYRWLRDDLQFVSRESLGSLLNWVPAVKRSPVETILAVNVGGCVVPLFLAVYELRFALESSQTRVALLLAIAVNVLICYRVARPVPGLGIVMPGFAAPLAAVGVTWLLLGWSDDYFNARAPIAFIAGVVGPIVGADLLHLRDLKRCSLGVMSIGGAGTFDGIVLSGLVAAFFA
jgi:uncharacterized membrane protein